jgi:p-hydroxybenzoate 3-monooxygenase
MHTQVLIVGAGPAGLFLAALLRARGVDSIVVEARSRDYVESRIRAGVLEQGTVDTLAELGCADRMHREGLVHEGTLLRFGGHTHRIDFRALTGKAITLYAQHEVLRDLLAARVGAGEPTLFEVDDLMLDGLTSDRPRAHFRHEGRDVAVTCDFVAGCDGFHGACRGFIPSSELTVHERTLPYGWLGILASAPPGTDELVYARHDRGFALLSMRSPSVSRLYLQCAPDEDLAAWPDERIWEELGVRLADDRGFRPNVGPILQRGVTPMRSFVAEPMRYGRLFLAGDAAHIVPPTGAKGLNLAVADVRVLAAAIAAHFARGDTSLLEHYSEKCLRRVWKVQRFSSWMTSLLHVSGGPIERRLQLAELDYVTSSRAAATGLAENYVGLPLEDGS